MAQYDKEFRKCEKCGITESSKRLRREMLHGQNLLVCVDEKACDVTQLLKLKLPDPEKPSVHEPGLVPPEHVAINARAQVEKEKLRQQDYRHRSAVERRMSRPNPTVLKGPSA